MRENLLKKQPTWGLRRAQGAGQKSATPATLTKVILVLLTMFLLPSAAWGQWDTKTFVFNGCSDDILYATDPNVDNMSYSWYYRNSSGYGASLVESKVKISVGDNLGKSVLTPPNDYTIKKVTLNYSNLQVTEGSKIYVRAVNRTDTTTHYTDPYLMTSEGTLDINLNDEGILSESLCFLIFSNDDKAYSYYLNSITITKIADYNLSIGGVPLTGSNVNPETGAVTGMTGISFSPGDAENSKPATLTLNNAIFGPSLTGIVWSGNGTLKIQYSGNNIINTRNGSELNAGSDDGYCILGKSSSILILSASNAASTLTLKPSTGGTPESNNSRAAISGFTDVQIDKTNGWGMYYTENYAEADPKSLTAGKEVIICKGQPLGISVAGVLVTNDNKDDILNDGGKVKFTPATVVVDNPGASTPATLTLDGATISGSIESSITPLTVYLIGKNTINAGESVEPFKYTGNVDATMTFGSSNEDEGELVMNGISNVDNISSGYTVGNDFTFYGENGSRWIKGVIGSTVTIYYNVYYGITINGTSVAKVNKNAVLGLSGSDVSYAPDDKILYIPENSTISDYTIKSHRAELNVQITGECAVKAINFDGSKTDEFGTHETKVLNIDRSSTSTPGKNTLTIDTGSDDPAISGFTTVNISENLHFEVPATAPAAGESYPSKVVFSDVVVYDLWVEGQQVTSRNKDDVKGENANPNIPPVTPSVVFDSETSTLNLTSANITVITGNESLSGVVSGLENLTVKFEGSNSIGKSGDGTFYGFSALDGKTCNIAFTATAGGSCYIEADTENAIPGFNKVTYNDGLAAYINDGFNIAPVTLGKPEFIGVFDDETGKLLSVKVKCIASIPDDQLDTPDPVDILSYDLIYTLDGGEETAYTGPITISGPCTLTAKTIVGNTSSDVATGKYFGAKKDVFTMAIGESLADLDWCTPSFNAETEYIICKFASESDIFNYNETYADEPISTKASGTGTINIELSYNDRMVTQILNNTDGYIATLTINVGEPLNSVFEGENTFGGLYSETNIQVPEGMKAYIITGIDEEKGTVITSPVDFIPAGVPVMLENEGEAKAITHVPYTGSATAPTNNKLNYSNPNTPAQSSSTDNWYVIYNNKFVKVTAGTQVKGGKCYLNLNGTSSSGTRGYYDIDGSDGTTGIREVKSEGVKGEKWNDGEWYTLQGQRVTKPTKPGLYILNGKKVVIK